MKCTNCGENDAYYHYKYNINGKITEAHLCPDCARKLEGTGELKELNDAFAEVDSMFDDFDRMMQNMWSTPFMGRRLSPFGSYYMPSMVMPRIGTTQRTATNETAETKTETKTERDGIDPELSRKREINALREEMKAAAEREDYEKAAELRDKIKNLES